MPEEYVSLKPSDAIHGGGMVPEGDYEITDAKFAMWDYAGTRPIPVPALGVEFKNVEEQVWTQYYSAGDAKNFVPSEDGKRLKKIGTAGGLNDQSNCYAFMASVVNAGLSEDKLGNDISIIIGMKVLVSHQVTQEREIRGQKRGAGTIAVIGKIHSMPGEKSKTAAKKPAAKAAAAPNGNEGVLRPKAVEVLTAVLRETPNHQMERKALSSAVYKKIPGTDSDRGDVLNLVIREEFLSNLIDVGVLYDAEQGVVIYAGD